MHFFSTFNDTLNVIFSRSIYIINEQNNPIIAFSQKPNIFYIYDKIEDACVWSELSKDKLIRFLSIVQMKISKAFCEWKKKNKDILSTDKMATLCDKATVKLMTPEFKQESTLSKIRSIMYGKMKTDMKVLVEYEFEF